MVLAGFIIAQMVIAAEKVRGMSAARAFRGEEITHVHEIRKAARPSRPHPMAAARWLTVIFLLCYNTDIKGERYEGDKEKVLGKGSDTHQ